MRYEWELKPRTSATSNGMAGSHSKWRLWFSRNERCLVCPDRIDRKTGEQRWHAIGAVPIEPGYAAVLIVAHVYREEEHGEEIVRIISARAAEKHEIRRYQGQALD